jgi:hypothetical protein
MPSGGRRSTTWDPETAVAVGKRGGRPPGAKDKVPRSAKASIAAIFREIATTDPDAIRKAIYAGLTAEPPKSYQYVALAAAYLDGKPESNVKVEVSMKRITTVHRYADGTERVSSILVGPAAEIEAAEDTEYIDGEVEDAAAAPRALPPVSPSDH